MIQKIKDKKGFTLVEMLIVVAIIAILVAIAIPIFSTQLDKAKDAVDSANLRSATSMAVAQSYLDPNDSGGGNPAVAGNGTYYFEMGASGSGSEQALTIGTSIPSEGYNQGDLNWWTASTDAAAGEMYIKVVVADGDPIASWE